MREDTPSPKYFKSQELQQRPDTVHVLLPLLILGLLLCWLGASVELALQGHFVLIFCPYHLVVFISLHHNTNLSFPIISVELVS